MASIGEQVLDTFNCQLCKNVDTMDMVQCDLCDLWFHFVCVGVAEDVAHREWTCKCCIDIQRANQDKKKCSGSHKNPDTSEKHPGSNKNPDDCSQISLNASSRKSLSARRKAVALEKLYEEQNIKLDILNRKYRILESPESETEADSYAQSSIEQTLHWAKEIQNLSSGVAKMTARDNVSISLSDYDREVVNKHSGQQLKDNIAFQRAADSKRQSFHNFRRQSKLTSELAEDQQQQQQSHSKATDGQFKIDPKVECGVTIADLEEFFRKYKCERSQSGIIGES